MKLINTENIPWHEVRIDGFVDDIVTPEDIDKMPTIDVDRPTMSQFRRMATQLGYEPVVHGRWKTVPYKRARVCSRCDRDEPYKFTDDDVDVYDYCPHCGAKMDEVIK